MKVSLLIVNYNTEEHICQLLADLQSQSLPKKDWEIVIVNNIQNDLLDQLTQKYQTIFNLKIITSENNIGFGRAMNLGASISVGKHLLITNPDIMMKNKDFLFDFLAKLEMYPNYGVATCQLLNNKGEDKSEFYDFEFHETFGISGIAWFSGAFLAVRRIVYEQIGGFDPDFFMYCEDEDLCLRIHRLGLNYLKINELYLHHIGGASEPVKSYDFFYRWFRSQILFAYKHFEEKRFYRLLDDLYKKSAQKLKIYKSVSFLNIPRYKTKQNQWQAMYDVVEKTKISGIDWLYFRP